ncbi:MAG TPA: hypothetical protein VFW96_06770 [Thermomicrobiales bacterium]|nr:hypothetical protein [Thermomicrobiales bacterium]
MVRKLRELRADLRRVGYHLVPKRGKGDHEWWSHPLMPDVKVSLDGRNGDDARHYQETQVAAALAAARAAVTERQRRGEQ